MRNASNGGSIVVAAVFAFCMAAPAASAKQPYTARVVHVLLQGCGDEAPASIRVVPDGDEKKAFRATRKGDSDIWEATPGPRFNADGLLGSLRAGRRRTGCVRSIYESAPAGAADDWIVLYRFTCDFARGWQLLTVETDADARISTVRDMPQTPNTIPCKEKSLESEAPRKMDAVAFKHETIYVHFGDPPRSHQYYDIVIRKGRVFAGKPIQDELLVKRPAVLQQQAIRGGRGIGNATTIRNDFNLDPNVKTVTLKRVE